MGLGSAGPGAVCPLGLAVAESEAVLLWDVALGTARADSAAALPPRRGGTDPAPGRLPSQREPRPVRGRGPCSPAVQDAPGLGRRKLRVELGRGLGSVDTHPGAPSSAIATPTVAEVST